MKSKATAKYKFISALASVLCLITIVSAIAQDKNTSQDPQQSESIKLNTSLVTLPVMVSDRYGRFVPGLTQRDFQVGENGEPQEIASFSSTREPFNVALLIDTSRSTRNKLGAIRKAALQFIKQLQPNDRVLIVSFDERINFLSELSGDRRELERTIRKIKSSYLTSLYDAIYLTITEKLNGINGRKALVLLTDGVDTYSRKATFESAVEIVTNMGVICYAVQYDTRNDGGSPLMPDFPRSYFTASFINSSQDRAARDKERYLIAHDFLSTVTTRSGALLFKAESIENTAYAFGRIANELRNQYTISYYPTNEKRDGTYRSILVSANGAGFSCRTRQGYRTNKSDFDDTKEMKKQSNDKD